MQTLNLNVRLRVIPELNPGLIKKLTLIVAELLDDQGPYGLYHPSPFYPDGRIEHHYVTAHKRSVTKKKKP